MMQVRKSRLRICRDTSRDTDGTENTRVLNAFHLTFMHGKIPTVCSQLPKTSAVCNKTGRDKDLNHDDRNTKY